MSRRSIACAVLIASALTFTGPGAARAQLSEAGVLLATLDNAYRVVPNVTYHTASGVDNKLDLYLPRNAAAAPPVLLLIHGGGWVIGQKETYTMRLLPYLEMGFAVVNVEYRLANVALAPAAVEDCLCALRWIAQNAEEYNLDASRVVVTGMSAGGHLSLTTGMIPSSAGLDRQCMARELIVALDEQLNLSVYRSRQMDVLNLFGRRGHAHRTSRLCRIAPSSASGP